MFFKKKTINDLLVERIKWKEVGTCEFISEIDQCECKLKMNDFPDEPMYTLSFQGESVDFDDKPQCWDIPIL